MVALNLMPDEFICYIVPHVGEGGGVTRTSDV